MYGFRTVSGEVAQWLPHRPSLIRGTLSWYVQHVFLWYVKYESDAPQTQCEASRRNILLKRSRDYLFSTLDNARGVMP